MGSSPPQESASPVAAFDVGRFAPLAREEGAVCFAAIAPPPESGTSRMDADGTLEVSTELHGVIVQVQPDAFVLERPGGRTRVRYLLPSAVDLAPLLGAVVRVELDLILSPHRAPTVNAVLRDARGQLLLWARDGQVPGHMPGFPRVRIAHDPRGPKLAFKGRGAPVLVGASEVATVRTPEGSLWAAAVRVTGDDAAFVVVKR
jgi:hypothetical protein